MTLIELLVVIAIIVVLMSLLVPAALRTRGTGRKAQCQNNLAQLAKAVQQFATTNSERMPVYYGVNTGQGGDKFGGWLLHLLPYLDQQVAYDRVPGNATRGLVGWTWAVTGSVPSVPASPDYNPGTYVRYEVGRQIVNGVEEIVYEYRLEGRRGTPASGGRIFEWVPRYGDVTAGVTGSLFDLATDNNVSFPFLIDTDDTSVLRAPSGTSAALANMQLTNYFANAHVFMKFGPRILSSATPQQLADQAGKFRQAQGTVGGAGATLALWSHPSGTSVASSGTTPVSRSLTPGHVPDGLPNTILFAEGRRQCAEPADADSGRPSLHLYRTAFFPSGLAGHEHGFGIECLMRESVSGTVKPTTFIAGTSPRVLTTSFGNTLMFQTMPTVAESNPLRLQTMHGDSLMAAMCDGSVRAIKSNVSRREPMTANATGRVNFGAIAYNPDTRGANAAPRTTSPFGDGIWDMLMVPNDPPGNVLPGSGQEGQTK
jgi:type II secretory pathway pseudopilin PulG